MCAFQLFHVVTMTALRHERISPSGIYSFLAKRQQNIYQTLLLISEVHGALIFLTSPARQLAVPHTRPARSSTELLLGLPARPNPRYFLSPLRPPRATYTLYSARPPVFFCHGAPPVPWDPCDFFFNDHSLYFQILLRIISQLGRKIHRCNITMWFTSW